MGKTKFNNIHKIDWLTKGLTNASLVSNIGSLLVKAAGIGVVATSSVFMGDRQSARADLDKAASLFEQQGNQEGRQAMTDAIAQLKL